MASGGQRHVWNPEHRCSATIWEPVPMETGRLWDDQWSEVGMRLTVGLVRLLSRTLCPPGSRLAQPLIPRKTLLQMGQAPSRQVPSLPPPALFGDLCVSEL